ncbi:hypothetical protein KUV85_11655 [Nocardioides panacisoli]|uniref:hypothetical protein n=1 Tax=Nocardioides panacisoli TaxID=627624 RepID=UPI001C635800|nr:hypothetical protein [Nocardioides panacisoli]QYJ02989.1 hypothetical protein KUV85_11655 [Nocardioides panacisoli]
MDPLEDLRTVGASLWGDADIAVGPPPPGAHCQVHDEQYVAVPSAQRPRFLVSADLGPTATSRLLREYNSLRATGPRLARAGLALLAGLGWSAGTSSRRVQVHHRDLDDTGLRGFLARELGRDPHTIALACGVRVAHGIARPIVTVADRRGRPLLFVKLAGTALHQRRLRNEYEMLGALADRRLPGFHTPAPAFWRHWNGHALLAVEPLPREVEPLRPRDAGYTARALASLTTERIPHAVGDSPWLHSLRRRAGHVAPADRERVTAGIDRVVDLAGDVVLPHDVGHGDWSFWNMAHLPSSGRVALWDWEFGHPRAPRGLDELHWDYAVATTIRGVPAPRVVARQRDLHDGRGPAARTVRVLHTLDMATRLYENATLGDADAAATAHRLLDTVPG